MSIRGITFVNQIVKSDDDASLHNMLLSGRNGVMKGCATTFDSSHIYVASGQFVILGRQVEVQGTETITPEAVTEGTKYCRLVFEIDLSKTNTTETFGQGYFKVLSSSVSYPGVTQEDLTAGGTVYQYPWARFTQTVNGIANFANDTTSLQFLIDDVLSAESENPVQNKAVCEALDKKANKNDTATDSEKLGGKKANEYVTNEKVKSNGIWNELTEKFDLNKALGKYRTANANILKSLLNRPEELTEGEATVEWFPSCDSDLSGLQVIMLTGADGCKIFIRQKRENAWNEWDTIFTLLGGDIIKSNTIEFNGGLAFCSSSQNHVEIFSRLAKDGTDKGNGIIIYNQNAEENKNAIYYRIIDATGVYDYEIFHTGTAAELINKLIESGDLEVGEKAYVPSNNLLKTLLSSEVSAQALNYMKIDVKYIARWVPDHTGQVKISARLKGTKPESSSASQVAQLLVVSASRDANDGATILEQLSIGAIVKSGTNPSVDNKEVVIENSANSAAYTTHEAQFAVIKGVPVYFCLRGNGYSGSATSNIYTAYCDSIKIYADEVK